MARVQLSTATDQVTSFTPFPMVALGAGDNQVAIQAAIDAAKAACTALGDKATATVTLPPGYYKTSALTMTGNVHLLGHGTRLTSLSSGPLITVSGLYNRISQLYLQGGGVDVNSSGIALATGSKYCKIDFCRFDQFAGRAIHLQAGSVAHWIRDCYAQNCLLDTASLADFTGVLDINGTDHFITGCELTGSRLTLSSASRFVCAMTVREPNHFISDTVAEIADTGIYIAAGASFLRFSNVRADLNLGHGWHIDGGSGSISGCSAINNGQAATSTYDGFSVLTSGSNFQFTGCFAEGNLTNRHRYGFQDQTNSFSNFNVYTGCRSRGHAGGAGFFTLAFSGSIVNQPANPPYPITAAATTASVDGATNFYFQNVGAVTFTNWTLGRGGQRITVIGDGFTTIAHNATIKTSTGANKLLAALRAYSFLLSNGVWIEVGP